MHVRIDYREKHSRIEHAEKFYTQLGDDVYVQELPFGDFVFDNQVVIEYKTLPDFVQSVKSGRVFNQCIDQSQNFRFHFLVVMSNYEERKVYFQKLKYLGNPALYFDDAKFFGAIARLNTFTTVIQASNELEALKFMRIQARKCLDNKHVIKRLKTKTSNPCFNFLMNIKHISDTKADLIVKELELETLEDLLNITNDDLQQINGIGSATTGIILKAIRNK